MQLNCLNFIICLNSTMAALRRVDNQNALLGSPTQFIDEIQTIRRDISYNARRKADENKVTVDDEKSLKKF